MPERDIRFAFGHRSASHSDTAERGLATRDVGTLMNFDVSPELHTRLPAMVGHGAQILFVYFEIDHHTRRWQVFLVEVLEIPASDLRLDFFIAFSSGSRSRGKGNQTTRCCHTQKASPRVHM